MFDYSPKVGFRLNLQKKVIQTLRVKHNKQANTAPRDITVKIKSPTKMSRSSEPICLNRMKLKFNKTLFLSIASSSLVIWKVHKVIVIYNV